MLYNTQTKKIEIIFSLQINANEKTPGTDIPFLPLTSWKEKMMVATTSLLTWRKFFFFLDHRSLLYSSNGGSPATRKTSTLHDIRPTQDSRRHPLYMKAKLCDGTHSHIHSHTVTQSHTNTHDGFLQLLNPNNQPTHRLLLGS